MIVSAGIFQQQPRGQLPVEPRDRRQAAIDAQGRYFTLQARGVKCIVASLGAGSEGDRIHHHETGTAAEPTSHAALTMTKRHK